MWSTTKISFWLIARKISQSDYQGSVSWPKINFNLKFSSSEGIRAGITELLIILLPLCYKNQRKRPDETWIIFKILNILINVLFDRLKHLFDWFNQFLLDCPSLWKYIQDSWFFQQCSKPIHPTQIPKNRWIKFSSISDSCRS